MKRILILFLALGLFLISCGTPGVYLLDDYLPQLMNPATQYPYTEKITVTQCSTGKVLEYTDGGDHDLIRMRLEGIQYLNEGVYIYQAEGGRRESQTLVGLAEGEQKIIVSNKMTITFEVDEGNHVVAERVWHNESDPTVTPGTPGGEEQPGGGNNPPVMTTLYNIDEEEVPLASHLSVNNELVETLDEEVPLAAVPETGDHSVILILAIIATTLLLGATFIFDKKRATVK